MRPDFFVHPSFREAVLKGYQSAKQNLPVMAVLLAAMSAFVVAYYWCPTAAGGLFRYAHWQGSGGILRAALAAGFAGGILSELSIVYFRDGGRWNATHAENMAYRFALFFLNGMIVYEFYQWQAVWFGDGLSWRVLLPKVVVDQFIYSVLWSTPYQTLTFRWQVLRFSSARLWKELNWNFIVERMLPVLVTNWMFWIPGVTLVYAMPLILQMPLGIFATAIWSLLLAGLAKPTRAAEAELQPAPLVP